MGNYNAVSVESTTSLKSLHDLFDFTSNFINLIDSPKERKLIPGDVLCSKYHDVKMGIKEYSRTLDGVAFHCNKYEGM